MKKRFAGVLLIIALLIPMFTISVSAEDGIWYDLDLPKYCEYKYCVKYDNDWQVKTISYGVGATVGIFMAGCGLGGAASVGASLASSIFGEWVLGLMVGHIMDGYYYDYIYEYTAPEAAIYPYAYFHHYVYYVYNPTTDNYQYVKQDTAYEFAPLPR